MGDASKVEVAAKPAVVNVSVNEALAAMGVAQGDLSMSMMAAIEHGLRVQAAPSEPNESADACDDWDDLVAELKEMGFEDEVKTKEVLSDANVKDVKDAVKMLVAMERANR